MTDLDALTLTLWGEARGEPIESLIGVGNVIRNRAAAGHTVAQVCLAPHQFSCWTEEAPQMAKAQLELSAPGPALKQCRFLATGLLDGSLLDNTHGANHYYADYIAAPVWAAGRPVLAKLGRHIFLHAA